MQATLARHALALSAFALFNCIVPAASAAGPAPAVTPSAPYKVVVQISEKDPAKWNLALNNIHNAMKDLGPGGLTVELVAYGPGIDMLKFDSVVADRLGDAMAAGVKVIACQNTMTAQKLTPADMHDGIGYVQAGVVELIRRQSEGYAYLRP